MQKNINFRVVQVPTFLSSISKKNSDFFASELVFKVGNSLNLGIAQLFMDRETSRSGQDRSSNIGPKVEYVWSKNSFSDAFTFRHQL